ENLSRATQRRECERYCVERGLEVTRVFVEEGESAKTTERPELQKLLDYCREHQGAVQHVVVYSINRLARNSYDHAALRVIFNKYAVTLRSATEPISEDSTGRFMENVLAAVAQFDNDVRADRTIAGMKAAVESGRWTFVPPLGYMRASDPTGRPTIAPDPERAPLVRKAFELCASGRHRPHEVLGVVNGLGLRTLRGRRVSAQTFGQMLR